MGSREAIFALAAHRDTLWLGLIFVMSAAFAREYDGEDLLYEPWHLLLPVAASLGTSFVLFTLVSVVAWRHGVSWHGFWSRYRVFLSLYWMTAPLAWLYAIPAERFLNAGDATSVNLYLLAIVSLWRVVLITRVLSLLFSTSATQVFFVVMLFADTLAITLVSWIDVQILAVMGGVRLTEAEQALAAAKILVILLGALTWPIWFIGTMTLVIFRWSKWHWALVTEPLTQAMGRPVWLFGTVSVLVWSLPLPWTQPEQQLRGSVERDFRGGRYRELIATMSAHQRDDFPPHWDPPPRIGGARERRQILKIIPAMAPETAPWVRDLYFDKLAAALGRNEFPMDTLWHEAAPAEILSVLESHPNGEKILRNQRRAIAALRSRANDDSTVSNRRIDATLLRIAEVPPERPADLREHPWSESYANDWHTFLSHLEGVKDHELVLEAHGTRLRNVVAEPQFVPEEVLVRIRKLLIVPDPVKAGSPVNL